MDPPTIGSPRQAAGHIIRSLRSAAAVPLHPELIYLSFLLA
ncbi:MAG: hypothetical protein OEY25_05560 [Candidatus Aminicenantes bacterium]|nr:hypothetical protein [Candidatus Aminicenantes bacterium]MDH5466865.1 hypothetical protein [Candidatus Aminicenantes bacterium]